MSYEFSGILWVPRPKNTHVGMRNMISGHFGNYTILDAATRKIKRQYEFFSRNLILDIGLERIGSRNSVAGFIRIGTGTTAPAEGDTQLVSQSASASTIVGGSINTTFAGAPNYESINTISYEFAQGALIGNYSEIGIGWASTGATLYARDLIRTPGGAPTTINVSSSEILQVSYRMAWFPALADATGVVNIGGVNYNYTSRLMLRDTMRNPIINGVMFSALQNATVYNGEIGALTAQPSGTQGAITAGTFAAYVANSRYLEHTVSATTGQGNIAGGIRSLSIQAINGNSSTLTQTQMRFGSVAGDATIPKTSNDQFGLTIRHSWARRP